jgi:hypothetical protein
MHPLIFVNNSYRQALNAPLNDMECQASSSQSSGTLNVPFSLGLNNKYDPPVILEHE